MDLPVDAPVNCTDGPCGRSAVVILNPANQQVTHIVVDLPGLGGTARLVPVDVIRESTPERIELRLSRAEVEQLEPFVETSYLQGAQPFESYNPGQYRLWPYAVPEAMDAPATARDVPPGRKALRRGITVAATDGPVGKVDEFIVDPVDSQITHLVLRQGHLWGQRDITIPASDIIRIEEDTVYLTLDKHAIGTLPALAVRRWWQR